VTRAVPDPDRAAVSVRAATAGDVPEIARIQLATWRTAYGGLLPPQMLAAATPQRATAEWHAAVVRPPSPRHRVLVAREQEWTVGFAAFGPSEEDGDPPGTGIVHALLVEPRWGRRGHGSRLLAATVDHLRADGMTAAVAWLLDGDTASAAFYESAGWARDGTVRTLTGGTEHTGGTGPTVREARFHASLEEGEE
jgi:GNAT superfamily N-acetyltransferase